MRRTGNADDQARGVAPGPDDPDGRPWRLGTAAPVRWITEAVVAGGTVTTALPAVFPAYAVFEEPDPDDPDGRERRIVEHERAVVSHLRRFGPPQWWLGYLDTGAHDVVFPEAARVSMYFGWDYVLVEAGPEAALAWRNSLPDLLFPLDRSWLCSMLWDDGWTCVGGPEGLIEELVADPLVSARRVRLGEPLHPSGHLA